jgi:hypothetical protein
MLGKNGAKKIESFDKDIKATQINEKRMELSKFISKERKYNEQDKKIDMMSSGAVQFNIVNDCLKDDVKTLTDELAAKKL